MSTPNQRLVKLRKCCKSSCRLIYADDEAVQVPDKRFRGCTTDACPKCGCSSYYMHNHGEKKAPKSQDWKPCLWPIESAPSPIETHINSILAQPGLTPETVRLLELAKEARATGKMPEIPRMIMILDPAMDTKTPEGEWLVAVNYLAVGPLFDLRAFDEIGSKTESQPPEFYTCHPDTWAAMSDDQKRNFVLK